MPLAIDGTATGVESTALSTVTSGTLTTTNANDVIVAFILARNGGAISVSSMSNTGSLSSWTKRKALAGTFSDTADGAAEVWWATASGTFSGTITAHFSAPSDEAVIAVFGVSGANTASPWDTNVSLPASNTNLTATASQPTVTGISTSNANDILLAFVGSGNPTLQTTQTAGANYQIITTINNTGFESQAGTERDIVSSTQSSVSATFGVNWANWFMISDAIVAAAPSGAPSQSLILNLHDLQRHPADPPPKWLWPGVPPKDRGFETTRKVVVVPEQPQPLDHPRSVLRFAQPKDRGFETIRKVLITVQEQPWHPSPLVLRPYPPKDRGFETIDNTLGIPPGPQEQPFHPPPKLFPSLPPRVNVGLGVENSIGYPFLIQEQPGHPQSVLRSYPPKDRGSEAIETSLGIPSPPQPVPLDHPQSVLRFFPPKDRGFETIDNSLGVPPPPQEQPWHPLPRLFSQFAAAAAAAAVIAPLITAQEQPTQPQPQLFGGVPPVALVIPPGTRSFITTQEQPWHPLPVVFAGTPPEQTMATLMLIIQQETPWHPDSRFFPGPQPVSQILPPITTSVATRQEQPGHPPSFFWSIYPTTQPAIIGRTTIGRQEQPDHPPVRLWPGVQPVSPTSLIGRTLFTIQELPWHPASVLRPSVIVGNVAFSIRNWITVGQEQPGHPAPTLTAGVFPFTPTMPIGTTLVQGQFTPDHPAPALRSGVQPRNSVPPEITDSLQTTQELPWHPASFLRSAPPPVAAPPPGGSTVIIGQEQPFHPPPFLRSAQLFSSRQLFGSVTVYIRQEYPSHPPPVVLPGRRPDNPIVFIARQPLIVTQELPWHPASMLGGSPVKITVVAIINKPKLTAVEAPVTLIGS